MPSADQARAWLELIRQVGESGYFWPIIVVVLLLGFSLIYRAYLDQIRQHREEREFLSRLLERHDQAMNGVLMIANRTAAEHSDRLRRSATASGPLDTTRNGDPEDTGGSLR